MSQKGNHHFKLDECLETLCYGFRNVFMNFRIRKANERGTAEHGWLHANFSFSFANYYDPEWSGFHSLIVMNNDIIEPGGGFPTHPHRTLRFSLM